MTNLDMKKTLKHLYNPSEKAVSVVDIPPMGYLMIDGTGNPNTSQHYRQSVEALYTLAYAIRALHKSEGHIFTVMPLEGLWQIAGDSAPPQGFIITTADKEKFMWTMMILQPEFVTANQVEQARESASKKKDAPTQLGNIRFESYHEGECVQIMHIGSYDDEGPTVARLHTHIEENGWTPRGHHHEIYLSDPRKVTADKLKTIIRHPFTR